MPGVLEIPLSNADTTSGTGSATGLTVAPVGRSGDLWLASYLTVGGTTTHTPPGTDWLLVADTGDINNTLRLSVWRKRAIIGSFPVAFSHSGSLRAALAVRAFINDDGIEGTPAAGGAGAVTSHTHTAHTAGAGVERLWVLVTAKATAGGATTTINNPSGFAETADLCTAHGTNPNGNLAVQHKLVGAGSTGTQLIDSADGVARTWAGVGFLLKPRNMRLPR